jgi:hypothetical protein
MPNNVNTSTEITRPAYFKRYEINLHVSYKDASKNWDTKEWDAWTVKINDWLKSKNNSLKFELELRKEDIIAPASTKSILQESKVKVEARQDDSDTPDSKLQGMRQLDTKSNVIGSVVFKENWNRKSKSHISAFPNHPDGSNHAVVYLRLKFTEDEKENAIKNWLTPDQTVIDAINSVNKNVPTEIDGVKLLAAAPNWLMTGSYHGLTGGGSGGLPVPEDPRSQHDYHFDTTEVDRLIRKCSGSSRNVDIVIFDTALPANNSSGGQTFAGNPDIFGIRSNLIDTLAPQLIVHRAGQSGITLPLLPEEDPPGYTNKDYYKMSNHGTFIAGIINDIVPTRNIHLAEALNVYGVGATDIFADCLRALADGDIIPVGNKDNWSLVANFSLCIDLPLPNEKCEVILPYHDETGGPLHDKDGKPLYDEEGQPLKFLKLYSVDSLLVPARAALDYFNRKFDGYDVQIVAAAGNQGEDGKEPPPALYPAAFEGVLGVGSLEGKNTRAWYSNLADNPPYKGVVVFGGKSDAKSNMSDKAMGVLGVYVGGFPQVNSLTGQLIVSPSGELPLAIVPTSGGWGRWSGTSFATAIMSGILARAAAKGCLVAINQKCSFYGKLDGNPAICRSKYGEMIISVPQGRPLPWWVRIWYDIGDFFKHLATGS